MKKTFLIFVAATGISVAALATDGNHYFKSITHPLIDTVPSSGVNSGVSTGTGASSNANDNNAGMIGGTGNIDTTGNGTSGNKTSGMHHKKNNSSGSGTSTMHHKKSSSNTDSTTSTPPQR